MTQKCEGGMPLSRQYAWNVAARDDQTDIAKTLAPLKTPNGSSAHARITEKDTSGYPFSTNKKAPCFLEKELQSESDNIVLRAEICGRCGLQACIKKYPNT